MGWERFSIQGKGSQRTPKQKFSLAPLGDHQALYQSGGRILSKDGSEIPFIIHKYLVNPMEAFMDCRTKVRLQSMYPWSLPYTWHQTTPSFGSP